MTTPTTSEHAHDWHLSLSNVRAPTGPHPEHTMFAVLLCACGAIDVFPRCNYDRTTPEFRADFRDALAEAGLHLVVEASS